MLKRIEKDVVVVGSGFAGSLLALVARRLGLSVALLERGSHPRVVLGESTTPLANLVLADIARRYRMRRVFDLASYGSARSAHTSLGIGKKRGFTFLAPSFRLLVEASDRDEVADLQWKRAGVDAFFVAEAVEAGVLFLDRAAIALEALEPRPRLTATRGGETFALTAKLLVDASGGDGFLVRALSLTTRPEEGEFQTDALFSHFENVERLTPLLARHGHDVAAHPYVADDAAVHHLFDGGWMWSLRFDDGVVSAGFVLDRRRVDGRGASFRELLARAPLAEPAFASARELFPIRREEALVRFARKAAGATWALLPHAAYFVDPLFSSGIAHSLLAVERFGRLLERGVDRPDLAAELESYGRDVLVEGAGLLELVRGAYETFASPERFEPWAMQYFIAASSLERRRRAGEDDGGVGFLRLLDPSFRAALAACRADIDRGLDAEAVMGGVASRLGHLNREGFCDAGARGLYRSPRRSEMLFEERDGALTTVFR